jgi:hypothetical protein
MRTNYSGFTVDETLKTVLEAAGYEIRTRHALTQILEGGKKVASMWLTGDKTWLIRASGDKSARSVGSPKEGLTIICQRLNVLPLA